MILTEWENILRIIIVSIATYSSLIILLRGFGKRTLSKMNAFDMVVTIALGSILATSILDKSIPVAEGVTALFVLILLQYIISWISTRNKFISRLVKASPSLLVFKGELLPDIMKRERITKDEIFAMAREKKIGSLSDILCMVLESDGSITVLPYSADVEQEQLNLFVKPSTVSHNTEA